MPLDGPSILTVRLQSSPKFFGEVNPRPGNKRLFFFEVLALVMVVLT
jgi:hypothetical protein